VAKFKIGKRKSKCKILWEKGWGGI